MGIYAAGEIATCRAIARAESTGLSTVVAPIHLERLGTIEEIAAAKAELVQALPADGWAILNGDDELGALDAGDDQSTGDDVWAESHERFVGR